MVTFLIPLLLAAGLTTQEPEKVGPGVTAPVPTSRTEPGYTQAARNAKLEGSFVLSVVIGPEGLPSEITVLKQKLYSRKTGAEAEDDLGLKAQAVECVSQWRFRPGLKDGKPVAVQIKVELNFKLL
jgi:protein TonB